MKTKLIAVAAAAVITGCGGGGGSSDTPAAAAPSPSAEGQYIGLTSDNRTITATVLDTGKVYVQYGVAGRPDVIAGVVAGNVTSSNGTLNNGTGIDYNLEGQGTNPVTITGTYSAKKSLDATVTYSNSAKTTANLTYDTSYDTTPTAAAVTGSYSGTSAVAAGTDAVTLTVDGSGNVSGQGTACRFTGSLRPHASGNVYDIALTFSGDSGCAYPNTTASGIALLSSSQKVVHAMLHTPSNAGILFLGTKS
ncbi:MAG: hypothetical protein LBV73_16790 [Paraburkholderia sp.]|jgi:hypothetical protein|nr:hypothetical protein [Paraburkholderia sp.]